MNRHLILALEAPLMSFGAETVDNLGFTHRFPTASMLAGLLGNALGYRRTDDVPLNALQERLVFASALEREPSSAAPLTDFQTVSIGKNDRGWTTFGAPEGREGGAPTYQSPHLRFRDYYVDQRVVTALRLEPADRAPDLDDLAEALGRPARPLFIGRKSCLPSGRLLRGFVTADRALEAALAALSDEAPAEVQACWPDGEGAPDAVVQKTRRSADLRNWRTRLHGGRRQVHEGTAPSLVLVGV